MTADPSGRGTGGNNTELQVSTHDRVASLILALLVVVGFFTTVLFLVWLTTRVYAHQISAPVEYLEDLGESGYNALGSAEELEPPGVEELPDVDQPQLTDTLQAVTDVISTQSATLEAMEGTSSLMGKGRGLGDHRGRGTGGAGGRRPDRKINFITTTLEAYATQLDFFKIELGVLRPGTDSIDYARNLSQSTPTTRVGKANEEERNYFLWTSEQTLAELDEQLLAKAGINVGRGLILQFWPEEAWQHLLHVEADKAKLAKQERTSIRRTDFGVRSNRGGFELFVTDQRYR
jgi:hypothetical protein